MTRPYIKWTAERLEHLRELAKAGISRKAAGRVMGVSKDAIGGIAKKHGIDFVWQSGRADLWTDGEKQILRDIAQRGGSIVDAMNAIPKRSRDGIKKQADKLHVQFTRANAVVDIEADEPEPPRQRACLCCGHPFMSEHKGNRICTPCKNTSDWRLGGDYEGIGI